MKKPPFLAPLLFLLTALSAPTRATEYLSVLGDSLTKEYQITFPGLPGLVNGIDPTNPAARNWSEILHQRRQDHFNLGVFKGSLFNRWSDLRLLGHEYNWAVPGATARALRNLVTGQNLGEFTSDPDFATFLLFAPDWAQTAARLTTQVQTTSAAAVIWCGGNDLRFGNTDPSCSVGGTAINYQSIYDGDGTGAGNPQPLMDSIRASLQATAEHLKAARPGLPIAVCAVPHVGATPAVQKTSPTDEGRTGRITTALRALNAELREWTEQSLGGVFVDLASLTEDLIGAESLVFGGITFWNAIDEKTAADPAAAHNRYLFSHDGFHPGTALHAVVAQRVQAALLARAPATFADSPPLTDREIIVNVLGLPADTGFSEFMTASGAPVAQRGPNDDPDGDGLANLVEFALADNSPFPGGPVSLPTGGPDSAGSSLELTWRPRFPSNVYASIVCQQSSDLLAWSDLPATLITAAADGSHTARVPSGTGSSIFLRLKIAATP